MYIQYIYNFTSFHKNAYEIKYLDAYELANSICTIYVRTHKRKNLYVKTQDISNDLLELRS